MVGNGAPIPGLPRSHPDFLGMERGWGQGLKTYWVFFGDGDRFNFGVFGGSNPRKSPYKYWGYYGDGDNFNFGDFWGFIPDEPQTTGTN